MYLLVTVGQFNKLLVWDLPRNLFGPNVTVLLFSRGTSINNDMLYQYLSFLNDFIIHVAYLRCFFGFLHKDNQTVFMHEMG